MLKAVIIDEGQQGSYGKRDVFCRPIQNAPPADRRIGAVDHEEPFFDLEAFDRIRPNRKRVKAEALQIFIAMRANAVNELVCR